MSLAKRTITSISWRVFANLLVVSLSIVRAIWLARLLEPAVFGIYTGAAALVGILAIFPLFGMNEAFLHRDKAVLDEKRAAAVHFTLILMLTVVWTLLLTTAVWLLTDGWDRTALLVLIWAKAGILLTQTPRLILTRRVVHRRLSFLQVATTAGAMAVAISLALRGATVWALLATDIVSLTILVIFFYVWKPVWRPQIVWDRPIMAYYLNFGIRNLFADGLLRLLDKGDDLWTKYLLGNDALGFYSKAYQFASYPRRLLAKPINDIAAGTYAELKGKPLPLSQAFFRINALIVRLGFCLAGILALVAPEFIRIALGKPWLPMLDAFRLMLLYTMLDPIKLTLGQLLVVMGEPERAGRIRAIQLVVMLIGLAALAPRWGIVGVAIAVNAMLVVGIVLLLSAVRRYVDFSVWWLFFVPTVALGAGLLFGRLSLLIPNISGNPWRTGGAKLLVFTLIYSLILLLFEYRQIRQMVNDLQARLKRGK